VNPNALAAAALLVLPVGVAALMFARRDRVDWWTLLPAGLAVVVIGTLILVVTRSRTALIAVWLIALGLLVQGMPSRWQRLIAGMVVLAPLVVLTARLSVVITVDQAYLDAYNGWLSARGRTQILSQGLDRWKQSPWTGIGLNEFRHVYVPRPGDVPQEKDIAHSHNIFLQTALDIGVIGSAAYWGVLAFLWAGASQAARGTSAIGRAAAIGGAFCLITATLFGLTDAVPLGSKVGTFQWMACGLILAAWQIQFAPEDGADAGATP
jgi:O-antigen ligase